MKAHLRESLRDILPGWLFSFYGRALKVFAHASLRFPLERHSCEVNTHAILFLLQIENAKDLVIILSTNAWISVEAKPPSQNVIISCQCNNIRILFVVVCLFRLCIILMNIVNIIIHAIKSVPLNFGESDPAEVRS